MGRERRGKRVVIPGTVILKIMLRAFEGFSFSSSYFFRLLPSDGSYFVKSHLNSTEYVATRGKRYIDDHLDLFRQVGCADLPY